MQRHLKSIVTAVVITSPIASHATAATQVLARCNDGSSHGYELELAGDEEGFARGKLVLNDFIRPVVLADLICRSHEIDPTITDGPWVVATCNNVDWSDRYNVAYVVTGFAPAKAVVTHNGGELATLTCREVD